MIADKNKTIAILSVVGFVIYYLLNLLVGNVYFLADIFYYFGWRPFIIFQAVLVLAINFIIIKSIHKKNIFLEHRKTLACILLGGLAWVFLWDIRGFLIGVTNSSVFFDQMEWYLQEIAYCDNDCNFSDYVYWCVNTFMGIPVTFSIILVSFTVLQLFINHTKTLAKRISLSVIMLALSVIVYFLVLYGLKGILYLLDYSGVSIPKFVFIAIAYVTGFMLSMVAVLFNAAGIKLFFGADNPIDNQEEDLQIENLNNGVSNMVENTHSEQSQSSVVSKVVHVKMTGGLIGFLAERPNKLLEEAINKENQQGWYIKQVIDSAGASWLSKILSLLILIVTLGIYTKLPGYYIVLEKGK